MIDLFKTKRGAANALDRQGPAPTIDLWTAAQRGSIPVAWSKCLSHKGLVELARCRVPADVNITRGADFD